MKKKKLLRAINKFAMVDDIKHIHERIDALEKIKIDPANKHINELDGAIKDLLNADNRFLDRLSRIESKNQVLMDRTSVNYTKMSAESNYPDCFAIVNCMSARGATKEELDGVKKLLNKYIFRCEMFRMMEE